MMIAMIIVCVIAALAAVYVVLVAPGRLPRTAAAEIWQTAYAHRGLHSRDGEVPENSMAAFDAAIASGYGIELDVHVTADGQVVVFHDDDLARMCGAENEVRCCTYAELSQYRLLGTDERIPLLSEVLRRVDGRSPLLIELKNVKSRTLLCEKVAGLLDGYRGACCVQSFNPLMVGWFKKNRPQTVRGQLAGGRRRYKGLPFYQGFLLSALLTNVIGRPHFAAFWHEDARSSLGLGLVRLLGGKLVGWTVRDTDDIAGCQSFFDTIIFEFFRP